MFALIITIISIALVAALAIASIYYGGTTFSQGSAKAKAVAIIHQAQQVGTAVMLYQADHQGSAAALETNGGTSLLVPEYLSNESLAAVYKVSGTPTQPILYVSVPENSLTENWCLNVDKTIAPATSVIPDTSNSNEPYWCNNNNNTNYFFQYNVN